MAIGAMLACLTGLVSGMGAAIVIAVTSLYVLFIMADSAALTAGLIEASPPEARGTAMAVYSFVGFSGALLGPITFGAVLDAGGPRRTAPGSWRFRASPSSVWPESPPSAPRAGTGTITASEADPARDVQGIGA